MAYRRRFEVHLRRADETMMQTVEEAAKYAADFYSELYSSQRGTFQASDSEQPQRAITADELIKACSQIRGNTAPGLDGISFKVTKHYLPVVASL